MSVLLRAASGAAPVLESVLRSGARLASEYPLLFDPDAHGGLATSESDGGVRSVCAFLMRTLVTPQSRIAAGLIGSVATEEAYRGRGLANSVLDAAEAELARRGAVLAVLWANDPEFYRRRGYRFFGTEIDCVLPAALANALPQLTGVRALRTEDLPQIDALHRAHPERVERTRAETAVLFACHEMPEMEVLVCERWGKLVAYTCLGRGHDLRDVIHEWAGDAHAVLGLVRAHLELRIARGDHRDLYLIAPPSATDLARRLRQIGAASTVGVLGMCKLLDVAGAARLCARLLDRDGSVHARETAPDTFELVRGEQSQPCTDEQLVELLFTTRGEHATLAACAEQLGLPRDRMSPLAPFAWGLDSI